MATSEVEVGQLKHLGFVKILAMHAVVLVWEVYGFAKQKSGPLKSTIEKVEHVVTAVVRPIYYIFDEVPDDILIFLDNKVDEVSYIFDKRAPPIAKNIVSMVKNTLELMMEAKVEGPVSDISLAGKISNEASSIFNKLVPPVAKDAVSEAKKTSESVQEAKVKGPFATIPHVGNIFKEASHKFDGSVMSMAKGVGSMVKKTSDLVQDSPVADISHAGKFFKKDSHIFDEGALSIAKGVGSMVKKTSDLVQEGPSAAISYAGKISKETSHILDEGAKGVGQMVKKASDLVQEGPIAPISYAGKISKKASHVFDEYAPPLAKNVLSKAGSMVKNASDLVQVARVKGPFAAISHVGEFSKAFVVKQLATVWFKANQYTFLYELFEIVVPIATNLLKKYNHLVKHLKGKGCRLFSYFPLVPVEEIELAYMVVEAAAASARSSEEMVEKAAAFAGRFSKSGSELD